MEKKAYKSPLIYLVGVCDLNILEGTNETLPFDPGDDTGEALGKQRDYEHERINMDNDEWGNSWNL